MSTDFVSDKVFTLVLRMLDTIEANIGRLEQSMHDKRVDCTAEFRDMYTQIDALKAEVRILSDTMKDADHDHELSIQELRILAKGEGGKSGRDMGALSAIIVAVIWGLLQKLGII